MIKINLESSINEDFNGEYCFYKQSILLGKRKEFDIIQSTSKKLSFTNCEKGCILSFEGEFLVNNKKYKNSKLLYPNDILKIEYLTITLIEFIFTPKTLRLEEDDERLIELRDKISNEVPLLNPVLELIEEELDRVTND